MSEQPQELKKRLTSAAVLVPQASRWMFFEDSKTASLLWSIAGIYEQVKDRFERLDLQEHLPKQDAIEAEIQALIKKQKEENLKAMMQLFTQGKRT